MTNKIIPCAENNSGKGRMKIMGRATVLADG